MKKIKNIRKKLNDFLLDESGKMSRESILKIGLTTLGSIAAMSSMFAEEALAGHTNSYTDYYVLRRAAVGDTYDDYQPYMHHDHYSHEDGK